jgi:putative transposase
MRVARRFIAGLFRNGIARPLGTDETCLVMANTYTSLNIHYIFSTKNRVPILVGNLRERLWAFMGGIARENQMKARCIGGIADHVHLLVSMPKTLSIAKGIQLIKGGSSAWVHETFPEIGHFAWQEGYGAFSVSVSHVASTIAYIENQEEHHRLKSFQEEYLAFLKKTRD